MFNSNDVTSTHSKVARRRTRVEFHRSTPVRHKIHCLFQREGRISQTKHLHSEYFSSGKRQEANGKEESLELGRSTEPIDRLIEQDSVAFSSGRQLNLQNVYTVLATRSKPRLKIVNLHEESERHEIYFIIYLFFIHR